MIKQELWQRTKKILFWLTYAVLMTLNLSMFCVLSIDLYYEIFDPVYWRDNFTMYPYVDVEIPTPLSNKLKCFGGIFLIMLASIWGNYRLYKKKKGSLWILGILIYMAIGNIIYIDILGWGEWCPGHDFP